jgi:hypothetical protein
MQDIYWVYQERETEQPWAVQLFHVYSKRKPTNQSLEAVLYSEAIDTETNSVSLGLDCDVELEASTESLCDAMGEYVEITEEDKQAVKAALGGIINR